MGIKEMQSEAGKLLGKLHFTLRRKAVIEKREEKLREKIQTLYNRIHLAERRKTWSKNAVSHVVKN